MEFKFVPTLESSLDHFLGNTAIQAVEIYEIRGFLPTDLEKDKTRAINLLEKSILDGRKEKNNITVKGINEILEIAKGDWRDLNVLKQIYIKYYELKGREPYQKYIQALDSGIKKTY